MKRKASKQAHDKPNGLCRLFGVFLCGIGVHKWPDQYGSPIGFNDKFTNREVEIYKMSCQRCYKQKVWID